MKKLLKKLKEYWNVEPHQCNKERYTDENGVLNEKLYNDAQNSFNKEAKWEQMTHRFLVVYFILAIPMIILIFLSLFKAVLILGLFIGCISMLLG